ncbi:zf-TFIIB domain-containing protein [bacterium]|nr:zf-TFIIB domain-containing protein [bacterium]
MADSLQELKCPACQSVMTKVYFPQEGFSVDVCTEGCGGIFFDNREFKYFDEEHENIDEIAKVLKDKTFKPVDSSLPRTCPACGAKMVKNKTAMNGKIEIDECYSCGGKFLDFAELDAIRAEYKTEEDRRDAVLQYMYSTVGAELLKADQESQLAKNKRSLLKKFFDKIILG